MDEQTILIRGYQATISDLEDRILDLKLEIDTAKRHEGFLRSLCAQAHSDYVKAKNEKDAMIERFLRQPTIAWFAVVGTDVIDAVYDAWMPGDEDDGQWGPINAVTKDLDCSHSVAEKVVRRLFVDLFEREPKWDDSIPF